MEDIKPIYEFACQLAHRAGERLELLYHQQLTTNQARRQSPKGMKLMEDKTIDQWIIQEIQQHFPEHCMLTEESGLVHRRDNTCGVSTIAGHPYLWIIDPIDGSVNFSTHNPFFAISLAVMVQDVLELGAIEAPLLGEQFAAVRGGGAWLNGQRLQVSETTTLADCYLLSCDGGVEDRMTVFSTMIRNYYDQVKDFRKLGSAALECAWVASGRADAYVTMAIDPWDVAAGVLLIEEAGGRVTTFEGKPWTAQQLDIMTSNSALHQALLNRLWG